VGRLGSGPHVVGRLGSGMRVNASFQIIPSSVDGSVRIKVRVGPYVVGRLGSEMPVFSCGRSLYVDWL